MHKLVPEDARVCVNSSTQETHRKNILCIAAILWFAFSQITWKRMIQLSHTAKAIKLVQAFQFLAKNMKNENDHYWKDNFLKIGQSILEVEP